MPHDVQPFVNGFVERLTIHGMGGDDPLWEVGIATGRPNPGVNRRVELGLGYG